MPEVCKQTGKVIAVRGGSRILPVHIEAVDDAWLTNTRREISVDVHVNAALYESLAVLGKRRRAERGRVRASAADGHDDLQVRVQFLELLELMKIAGKSAVTIGLTVNSLRCREGCLVISIGVEADALI